jgi:hypothetical protein
MSALKMTISAAVLVCLAAQVEAAPVYRAVDVGFAETASEAHGFDMNARDVVVGLSREPIFWTNRAGIRPFPQPKEADWIAYALNDSGTMAGTTYVYADNVRRAVTVTPGMPPNFFLDGTWAADSLSVVLDISNKGEILGESSSPWLWSETLGLRKIAGEGMDVNRLNDSGHVVGQRRVTGPFCDSVRAFIYESRSQRFTALDGGPPNLDKPHCGHYSNATALNNKGQVIGYSNLGIGSGGADVVGFIWSRATGFIQLTPTDPRMLDIQPLDINESGQVIGTFRYSDSGISRPYSYFYWDAQTGVVDLQTLLDPQDPVTSDVVLWTNGWNPRINNNGTIMVAGKLRSAQPPRLIPANRTFVLLTRPG